MRCNTDVFLVLPLIITVVPLIFTVLPVIIRVLPVVTPVLSLIITILPLIFITIPTVMTQILPLITAGAILLILIVHFKLLIICVTPWSIYGNGIVRILVVRIAIVWVCRCRHRWFPRVNRKGYPDN